MKDASRNFATMNDNRFGSAMDRLLSSIPSSLDDRSFLDSFDDAFSNIGDSFRRNLPTRITIDPPLRRNVPSPTPSEKNIRINIEQPQTLRRNVPSPTPSEKNIRINVDQPQQRTASPTPSAKNIKINIEQPQSSQQSGSPINKPSMPKVVPVSREDLDDVSPRREIIEKNSIPQQRENSTEKSVEETVEKVIEKPLEKMASGEKVEVPAQEEKEENKDMSGNARVVPVTLVRNKSVDDFNEQVVSMLDDVERRVEQLREVAGRLEQEKEQILEMLNNVAVNTDLLRLGEGDRDDITATASRLAARTKAVEVVVNTPRSSEQQKALNQVNDLIEAVMQKIQDDMSAGKETCRRYLNACSPDQPDGPIDQRFQAQVIECTADDQKKIRRKLTNIIGQIERAERTCRPQF